MPKLPQHIEERFDKEFYDSNLDYVTLHDTDPDDVKSFIATILQERDITISMLYRNWKRRPLEDTTDFDDVIAKLSIQ